MWVTSGASPTRGGTHSMPAVGPTAMPSSAPRPRLGSNRRWPSPSSTGATCTSSWSSSPAVSTWRRSSPPPATATSLLWRGRPGERQDGPGRGRDAGGDRRPLRRGQGVPGQLHDPRLRQPGTGLGDRGSQPGGALLGCRGPATHARGQPRAVTDWRAVRRLVPEVLAALVRRYGHFDACEDAVQEALVAAAAQWPVQGWPENPREWLVTVASRRLVDQLRSDAARRRRGGAHG